ncbi:LolA family protein [Sphingomonas astaxanthinifaciens]|uniref:Outer-membrane lipoprotein carrier protein n=1 Tax=Sphingomonas astaxanthinifaciens DSM 22298 TaxID=1123267 RepID=A0ABQ5Z480_9SPHN|nr:outer membrane lipoprotein carrier protein LolA [Sphingomonas astaxanthinifaciens]GLR46785.1 outer-membrane lipoprotein carrier protein [Sphingomonas astaxanthinifaciens DSM 22298]
MSLLRFPAHLLAPVAIVALAAPAAIAQPADPLRQVEQSLSATSSMTARFTQTDGRGRSQSGMLSLKRPGKIRFQYGAGANMLLVGDGRNLTFLDYEVGQKSSWPIAKSPLAVLLSPQPNLSRIARVEKQANPGIVLVRARDARRPEFGTLLLAFSRNASAPGGLMLEGWTAIDAQNKKTTVKLDGQRYNVALADSTFTYAEPKKRK